MVAKNRQILDLTHRLMLKASVEGNRKPMERYMKNHFEFYGVKSPARKGVLKEVKNQMKGFDNETIFAIVEELWTHPNRESQYLALDLLSYRKKYWNDNYLNRIENLITIKSWWDTVDGLAPNIAGSIFIKNENIRHHWIEKWNNSDNMWLNRSALIHQLRYKSDVNLDLLFALVETHVESKEFFINKAAGWALRQASKFHPARVKEFIDNHPNLSNLTKREGSKYI